MIASLISLLVSLGCPLPRAEGLARDVAHVVARETPLYGGKSAREKTARVLASWAWYESSGLAHLIGDGGQACGVLQLHPIARYGHACEDILADRRLGLSLGLRYMRMAAKNCGGVASGLGAFASGKCGSFALVERRLIRAGVR